MVRWSYSLTRKGTVMSHKEVKRDVVARNVFAVYDPDGVAADATVFPSVFQVTVNGTLHPGATQEATITQVTDADGQPMPGKYTVAVPTKGDSYRLNYNDEIVCYISTAYDGVALDVERSWTVSSDATRRPTIR